MTKKSKTDAKQTGSRLKIPPDLEAAKSYLNTLDPEADRFTFQYFPDHGGGQADKLHGSLEKHAEELTRLNRSGHGIFITVNETDFRGRCKSNIQRIRAVFSDYDEEYGTLERIFECPLEPQIIVQSSPGNQQPYWMAEGLELEEFKPIQKRIQEQIGGDAVNARNRVMRLPGFYHMKDPDNPHLVKVVHEGPDRRYTAEEIKDTFPPVKQQDSGAQKSLNTDQGNRGSIQESSDDSTATDTDTAEHDGQYPTLDLDDETVLNKLKNAENSELFHRLFNGGVTTLHGAEGSQNEADAALVGLLVFYTGNDPEQIDRLFRRSALCREKWTTRPDYRQRTIREALKGRDESDFYSRGVKQSTGQIIRELIEMVPRIDWPNPRTNETDKATYRALLEIAERTCSLTFSASTRQLSKLSGISRPTVINALERLQSYGEGNEFVSKISDPEGTNATRWRIHRTSFNQKGGHTSGVRSTGKSSSGVSVEELQDTVYYPSALGRKARSIIQVLRRTGPVDSVTELADQAGTTCRTVRRKLNKLEGLEVTDSEKRGRTRAVWLQEGWKDQLEEYRCEAPTWLRDIDRRIKHKEEQILHEYQSDLQKEGDLKTVPIGSGGQKVLLPSDVIRYINLERKCREKVEIRRLDGRVVEEVDEMVDELAELQGRFDDRVNKLANDMLDLIREALQREREKWGVIDD